MTLASEDGSWTAFVLGQAKHPHAASMLVRFLGGSHGCTFLGYLSAICWLLSQQKSPYEPVVVG
jgi:hypothetical protein